MRSLWSLISFKSVRYKAVSTSGRQSWKKIRRRPAVTCTLTARAACTAARTMLSSCGHDAAWKSADKPASSVARGMLLAANAETSSMLPMRTTMPLVLVATFILPNWTSCYALPVCVLLLLCAWRPHFNKEVALFIGCRSMWRERRIKQKLEYVDARAGIKTSEMATSSTCCRPRRLGAQAGTCVLSRILGSYEKDQRKVMGMERAQFKVGLLGPSCGRSALGNIVALGGLELGLCVGRRARYALC